MLVGATKLTHRRPHRLTNGTIEAAGLGHRQQLPLDLSCPGPALNEREVAALPHSPKSPFLCFNGRVYILWPKHKEMISKEGRGEGRDLVFALIFNSDQ